MDSTEIMTVKEVAEFLRVKPGLIYKLIRDGKLKFFKLGPRKFRLTRKHIEDYLLTTEDIDGQD